MTIRSIFLMLLLFVSLQATAVYDSEKTKDWKYHVYICKSVTINAAIIAELQTKHGKKEIDKRKAELKMKVSQTVQKYDQGYPFDDTDAAFIADLVFSVRAGLLGGGFPFDRTTLINQGVDICVHILESFDRALLEKSGK